MKDITISTKPYGEKLYTRKNITFNPGLTVLVGCNGSGKTTMLKLLKHKLEKENIPIFKFDNLHDGGSRAISKASYYSDFQFMAQAMSSSEGENINLNIQHMASKLRPFITNGDYEKDKLDKVLANIINPDNDKSKTTSNERWILLDAIDSGYSVDNIVELKEDLFQLMIDDAKSLGLDLYIICSANEYELAANEDCIDITTFKHIRFKNYDEYKTCIMKTRQKKDKRYDTNNT